jgi:hypothetical protein
MNNLSKKVSHLNLDTSSDSEEEKGKEVERSIYDEPNNQTALGSGVTAITYTSSGPHKAYLQTLFPNNENFVYKWVYAFQNDGKKKPKDPLAARRMENESLLDELKIHKKITKFFTNLTNRHPDRVFYYVPLLEWVVFMKKEENGKDTIRVAYDSLPFDPNLITIARKRGLPDDSFYQTRWIMEQRLVATIGMDEAARGLKTQEMDKYRQSSRRKNSGDAEEVKEQYVVGEKGTRIKYIRNHYAMEYDYRLSDVRATLDQGFNCAGAYIYMPRMDGTMKRWSFYMKKHEVFDSNPIRIIRDRCRMVREVLEFMEAFHRGLHMTHNDFHMGNILVSRDKNNQIHLHANDFGRADLVKPDDVMNNPAKYKQRRLDGLLADAMRMIDTVAEYTLFSYVHKFSKQYFPDLANLVREFKVEWVGTNTVWDDWYGYVNDPTNIRRLIAQKNSNIDRMLLDSWNKLEEKMILTCRKMYGYKDVPQTEQSKLQEDKDYRNWQTFKLDDDAKRFVRSNDRNKQAVQVNAPVNVPVNVQANVPVKQPANVPVKPPANVQAKPPVKQPVKYSSESSDFFIGSPR